MAKSGKKSKDLDAKTRASNVKGGHSVWEDNRRTVPLNATVEEQIVKPVQGSRKTIQRVVPR